MPQRLRPGFAAQRDADLALRSGKAAGSTCMGRHQFRQPLGECAPGAARIAATEPSHPQRDPDSASQGRQTILGALAADGLVAAMTVAAATTTQVFLAFVRQVLLPALRTRPGCLVVMDNLAPHKTTRSRTVP